MSGVEARPPRSKSDMSQDWAGQGHSTPENAAVSKPRELLLASEQLAVYEALHGLDPQWAGLYLGAILVLRQPSNPARHVQAAHVLREILDAVLEASSAESDETKQTMGNRIKGPEAAWKRVLGKQPRPGADGWLIDDEMKGFLDAIGEFFEWKRRNRKFRRDQMRRAVRHLDPSGRPMPSPIEEAAVREGMGLRQYFTLVCHLETTIDESAFDERLGRLETFLLVRLRPRTFDDQNVLDEILRKTGDVADT